MDLPPQPNPSAIEVTHEDDPLTLEWRVALGGSRRKAAVGGWLALMALPILVGHMLMGKVWFRDGLPLLLVLGAAGLWAIPFGIRQILGLLSAMGDARLVLHPDSLIWVPGGGGIPEVHRKSEVLEVHLESREVILEVEVDAKTTMNLHLRGRFAPGDAAWLSDVLERWRSGILFAP